MTGATELIRFVNREYGKRGRRIAYNMGEGGNHYDEKEEKKRGRAHVSTHEGTGCPNASRRRQPQRTGNCSVQEGEQPSAQGGRAARIGKLDGRSGETKTRHDGGKKRGERVRILRHDYYYKNSAEGEKSPIIVFPTRGREGDKHFWEG